MRTRLSVVLATSFLIAAGAYADGDISGTVLDKATSGPLDFATVVLLNPETGAPLPGGTVTDDKGRFIIPDAPAGKYILRISLMGSVPQEREVTVGDFDVDFGRIELAEDARLLQEVVVTGQKSQMSVSAERRVFNVSSNIAASGASADELLASVPSVDVNSDGEISLSGNQDVMVWINGKEMGMNDDNRAQILRQIPAATV